MVPRTTEHFQNDLHFYFSQLKLCISSQKKEEVPPPGGRTLRPRRGRAVPYVEDSSEEEEEEEDEESEEEEEEARPKPIEARYLRGPPTGPRPPNKQV